MYGRCYACYAGDLVFGLDQRRALLYYIQTNMLGDERREFGAYLRRVRKGKNLTLRELAEKCRVPFPNISAIECGRLGRLGAGSIVATKLAAGLSLE